MKGIEKFLKKIDKMSHKEMARLWRWGSLKEIDFTNQEIMLRFTNRFLKFGGMTPTVAKATDPLYNRYYHG